MKLSVLLTCATLLLAWHGPLETYADGDFAAVPGTGWTDIRDLQSTCNIPGYFVNPSDCSRFYNCVDHSTPGKSLLLRYDFDCPEGLAFDESQTICNYPGPSGCVSPGSGWSKGSIFQSSSTTIKGPSWGSPGGKTVIRVSSTPPPYPVPANPSVNLPLSPGGGWESLRINRPPKTHPVPANPAISIPVSPGGGWEGSKVNRPPSYPVPANPSVNLPVSPGGWESFRISRPPTPAPEVFQGVKVTNLPSGGWTGGSKLVTVNTGVFQSAKVTDQRPPIAWGGSTSVFPANSEVFESAKVTHQSAAGWERPQPFPAPPPTKVVITRPSGGWQSSQVTVTPSPAPLPANPSYPGNFGVGTHVTVTARPRVTAWKITRWPPVAPVEFQGGWTADTTSPPFHVHHGSPVPANPTIHVHGHSHPAVHVTHAQSPVPANPSVISHRPVPANPSVISHSHPPVPANPTHEHYPIPANPSHGHAQYPAPANPSHGHAHYPAPANPSHTHYPVPGNSGFNQAIFSQTHTSSNQGVVTHENHGPVPVNPSFGRPRPTAGPLLNVGYQLPSGYAWQSTNTVGGPTSQEDGGVEVAADSPPQPQTVSASPSETGQGGFGIVQQVISETQSGQSSEGGKSLLNFIYERKEKQNDATGEAQAYQSGVVNQLQQVAGHEGSSVAGQLYQILASRDSGGKGRIIVLYAPAKGGGKRDSPPPVVEVQLSDDEDGHTNTK